MIYFFSCNHDTCYCWCQTCENVFTVLSIGGWRWPLLPLASRRNIYVRQCELNIKRRIFSFIYSIDQWTFPPNNNSSGKSTTAGQRQKCLRVDLKKIHERVKYLCTVCMAERRDKNNRNDLCSTETLLSGKIDERRGKTMNGWTKIEELDGDDWGWRKMLMERILQNFWVTKRQYFALQIINSYINNLHVIIDEWNLMTSENIEFISKKTFLLL